MNWLTELWDRWNRIPAPVPTASPTLEPPALKQEQFADLQAHTQVRQEREHHLHLRVIVGNNAHVTRNYGKGDVDETRERDRGGKRLTDAELIEANALGMEVIATDAKIIDLRNAKSFQKLRQEELEKRAVARFMESAP